MDNSKSFTRARSSIGDAAVDGLFNGVTAGIVMAIYIVLINATMGTSWVASLSAFDLDRGTSPVRGALIHLALAAILGITFSLICRLIWQRRSIGRGGSVILGLGYALLLSLIAQIVVTAGINIGLGHLATIHLTVAHLLYGGLLGWLTGRAHAD